MTQGGPLPSAIVVTPPPAGSHRGPFLPVLPIRTRGFTVFCCLHVRKLHSAHAACTSRDAGAGLAVQCPSSSVRPRGCRSHCVPARPCPPAVLAGGMCWPRRVRVRLSPWRGARRWRWWCGGVVGIPSCQTLCDSGSARRFPSAPRPCSGVHVATRPPVHSEGRSPVRRHQAERGHHSSPGQLPRLGLGRTSPARPPWTLVVWPLCCRPRARPRESRFELRADSVRGLATWRLPCFLAWVRGGRGTGVRSALGWARGEAR